MEKGIKKMSNHKKTVVPIKVVWDGAKGTCKKTFIDGKKQYTSK